MKRNYFLLFFLLLLNLSSFSQEYSFDALTVEDGLSQSSVTCITQDEKGFIWIGTRDGLNLYNGEEVKVFRKIPFDSTSLAANTIVSILAEKDFGLWVGTASGLQRYDAKTGKFEKIELFGRKNPIPIYALYRDSFGGIYVGTGNGFYSVKKNREQNKYLSKRYFFNPINNDPNNNYFGIITFLQDSQNNFWVTTSKGVFRLQFDENNDLITPLDILASPEKYRIYSDKCYAILEHSDGNIYASASDQILRYDSEKDEFVSIFQSIEESVTFSQIVESEGGQIVVSTSNGLLFISLKAGEVIASKLEKLPTHGISDIRHKINFLHKDNLYKGLFWLATDIGGVQIMSKRQKQFQKQLLKDIPDLGINNPYVRHIVCDENNIWVNLGIGVLIKDRKSKLFRFINHIYPEDAKRINSGISFLFINQKGKVLAGIFDEIVEMRIDENEDIKTEQYPLNQQCFERVKSIAETPNYYLLGGVTGNISVVEKEGLKEINCLDQSRILTIPGKTEITTLLLDAQSNLWVGTYNGLIVYPDFRVDGNLVASPKYFAYNANDSTTLIENNITNLLQDSNNNIWICTRNGLMKATVSGQQIQLQRINIEGLKNRVIYGILEDKPTGQLWMSTNSGLFCYDPKSGKVDHFNVKDGLQSNEFNTDSFFQNEEGEMFFGGPKGFSHFYPKEINLIEQAPPTWFTDLKTYDGKQFDLLTFDKNETLQLDYKQRSFSISFIGLDFFQPDELNYFYELEGATTSQRVPLGNSRQINFSELRPGSYAVHIKAANKDGAISEKGDTLYFTIGAPFWKMTWFYLLITSAVIALFWLAFYLRYRSKMNQLDAIESVRKSIAEDFHDELGSKLSIISMYSQFAQNELSDQSGKAVTYLEKVNSTAARLYESTRDLIWVLNPKNDTLYDLYFQLKDFGEELFSDTAIHFHSIGISDDLKDKNLPIRYKRHILLIFKEAMHNTLKHSSCKNINLSIDHKEQGLIFVLADDGQGFDNEIVYSGDGLKNMRHRAKQINSELHFTSSEKGTQIRLEIKTLKK